MLTPGKTLNILLATTQRTSDVKDSAHYIDATSVLTFICVRACVRVRVCLSVCACLCACVRVSVCLCACVCVRACVRVYMRACVRVYMRVCVCLFHRVHLEKTIGQEKAEQASFLPSTTLLQLKLYNTTSGEVVVGQTVGVLDKDPLKRKHRGLLSGYHTCATKKESLEK